MTGKRGRPQKHDPLARRIGESMDDYIDRLKDTIQQKDELIALLGESGDD